MAQYDGSIRINTQIDTSGASSQLLSLLNQIQKSADKIASLRSKMDALKDVKIPTEEYKSIQADIAKAEKELEKLIEKQAQMQMSGKDSGAAWDLLQQKIQASKDYISTAQEELQKLVKTGKAFTLGRDSAEYSKLAQQLGYEESNLERLNARLAEFKAKQGDVPKRFSKMRDSAKKAFDAISGGAKKSGGLFSTLASRLKGIMLTLLIFQWISKAFNAMIAGMKQGFENLAGYSNSYAQSVQSMKNAMSTLGNSFAAAFAPIVQMVIPWLNQLIGAMSMAISHVGQFMAALTGANTFTRAKKIQDGYNKSLEGTAGAAKKAAAALAAFDDINVLQIDKGGDGGAGAAVTQPKDMFEEVPIDESQVKLTDKFTYSLGKLKDAAKDALAALNKLWNEGLALLGNFTWNTLRDFYNHFLVPVGQWVLGDGLARFFNITNNLLKSIDWNTLLRALRDFYDVLAEFAKFTFKAVLDFYEYFLSPVSTWVMNEMLVLLLDTLTDFGNKINWSLINGALAEMWAALSKFTIGIGEGLILFWKAIEPTATSAAAGMVNALALSLQLLSGAILAIPESVLVALGGAIGGLLATFASYSAVSYVMDSISTAWTALYVAFDDGLKILAAHPYLAMAAGIAAVVGALLSLQERAKEKSEIEAYGDTVDALTRQFKSNREEIEKRVQAIQDYVDNAGAAEARLAEDLKTKYFELAEKQNKSNAEYDLMRGYASQLVEIFPELNEYINKETGLLEAQEGMIQSLIDKQKEYYRVQAAKEKMIELSQQQIDMEEQLAEQTEKVKIASEELKKALEDEEKINADYLNNMGVKRGEESIALQNARQNVVDLNAELQASIDTYNDIGQSIDRMSRTAAEGTAKMNAAGQAGGEGYVTGIADAINSKCHYLYEPVQGVADKVNAKFKTAGNDGADGYAEGFEEKTSVIENATKASIEAGIAAAQKAQDSHSPSEVYKSLGKDAVDGYNLGITENTESSITAVTEWAAKILDAMKTALGIGGDATGDATASMFGGMLADFETAWLTLSEKWAECLEAWKTSNDELYFGEEVWNTSWLNYYNAYVKMWADFTALWKKDLDAWKSTNDKQYFGAEEWKGNWQNFYDTYVKMWASFSAKWKTDLDAWRKNNDKLYFGAEEWKGNWQNYYDAYSDMWADFTALWKTNFKKWWDIDVEPFFSLKQWTLFGTNMKDGIMMGFKSIVAQIGGILNSVVDCFNQAMGNIASAVNAMVDQINSVSGELGVSKLSHVSAATVAGVQIPALASGAAIRGGNPFMAILGDQPAGRTNVEAPADLIKDMARQGIREELAGLNFGNGNMNQVISLNVDGQEFARLTLGDFFREMGRQGYNVEVLGVT